MSRGQPEIYNKTLSKKEKGMKGRGKEGEKERRKRSFLNDSIKLKSFMNGI